MAEGGFEIAAGAGLLAADELEVVIVGVNFDEVIEGELDGGGIFGGKAGGFGVIAVLEGVEAREGGVAGAGGFGSVGAGGGGLGRGARSFGGVGIHKWVGSGGDSLFAGLRPEANMMGGESEPGVEGSD